MFISFVKTILENRRNLSLYNIKNNVENKEKIGF